MEEKNKEVEIDLLELACKLWDNKKFIIKVTLIGAVVGLIIAFSIPKEYTTSVVMIPDAQSSSMGTMSSLAALAGINLGASNGDLPLASPDIYPSVFKSTPFLKGVYGIRVKDESMNIDTTMYEYMNNHQQYAWWVYIAKGFKEVIRLFSSNNEDSLQDTNSRIVSEEESAVLKDLIERISVESDRRTGITTIEVTMQSPVVTAFIADSIVSLFQSYIINYRTRKACSDLEYAEKLFNDSKASYFNSQQKLAAYLDNNKNVVSAKYHITQERLQNEVNLAYSIYNQTAQQLQLAKVKVQDNTPVFSVIQPAIQPINPSKPSKKIILLSFICLSIILSSCWILRGDLKNII